MKRILLVRPIDRFVRGEGDRAETTEPLLITQAIRVLPKADLRGPPKGFLVRVRELRDL